MTSSFESDYYIFVLVASLGVIQIAASVGRLTGLLIVKSPIVVRTVGAALIVVAFVWFFDPDTRNINDYEGGLDGNFQALYFALGAASAFLATVVLTSLINVRMTAPKAAPRHGLDALRHTTYFRALSSSLRLGWRQWRR